MQTIRQYIKNYKQLSSQRENHTERTPKKKNSIPSKNNQVNQQQIKSASKSNSYPRKISLPPIPEHLKKSKSIQLKESCVLHRYLQNRSIILNALHKRSKTEEQKRVFKVNRQLKLPMSLQELKMRPMEKYRFQLQNIRLAEKLLIIKPSMETRRKDQKRFFLKQQHYRDQISRSYIAIKSARSQRKPAKKFLF